MIGNDKKVYIISSPDYPMDRIEEELEAERYPYNFHFGRSQYVLMECDEVWTFGDCSDEIDYLIAKDTGKSIWVMG